MPFLSPYLRDTLTQHPLTRNVAAQALWLMAPFTSQPRKRRLAAFQISESPALWRKWQTRAETNEGTTGAAWVDNEWPHYAKKIAADPALTRSLLLKPPGPGGERGVLLVQFEYNWFRLLSQIRDWHAFSQKYEVLWGTSWSPTDYRLLSALLERVPGPGPVSVLASTLQERAKLHAFHPRIRCPDLLSAADWLDPDGFQPKPRDARQIDILMVANWAPFKRHIDLFKALPALPASLRIVLVGQKEGAYTREHILNLAQCCQVPQKLELHESLPPEQVRQLQCDAKTALILSLREGSCVAATEALMADCPLGMRAGAHVGALTHVNDQTGVRFTSRPLAPQLKAFLAQSPNLTPRSWAVSNLSCRVALQKLELFCRQTAQEQGHPWVTPLTAFRWNPYPEWLPGQSVIKNTEALRQLATDHPALFSTIQGRSY